MKSKFASAFLLCLAAVTPLAAQAPSFDTSGDHLLSGTYYFRQAIYVISTSADTSTGLYGDITEAITIYGNIAFNGSGAYSMTGVQVTDSQVGAPIPLSCYLAGTSCAANQGVAVAGTYGVSASGFGYISSPVATGDFIYGLVSANGIFVASSTETGSSYSDVLIAAPLASPLPANSTFSGAYTVVGYLPGGNPLGSADMFFPMNADGNGSLGTVNVTGYVGGNGSTTVSQSASSVKYFFSGGAAVVTYPACSTSTTYLCGQEYYYFSPDGNFFFGGAPNGYDMIIGMRNGTGTQNFNGLYYEAGLDQDLSQVQSSSYANFDGYYGSLNALSTGQIIAHDRLNSVFNAAAIGSTYGDSFSPPVSGNYTDTASSFQYAVGEGGAIRVGAGMWPYLGITVAVQAPVFTPTSSVFINPTGVVNAASSAPFTAGISNGEYISIYGTNLAPSFAQASSLPLPTQLNGVQVFINGTAAPIYYVSPTQISVVTPGANTYSLAQIVVANGGTASNTITQVVNNTTPGVFTVPSGGLGYSAALHTNGQLVTASNPAAPGESVEVFLTGLGKLCPPVADGAAAPSNTLVYTCGYLLSQLQAAVGGTTATIQFAGLTPTLAALYQINLTVPSTLTAGDYTLDVSGPDSYTSESLISIGSGLANASVRPPVASARNRVQVDKAQVNKSAKRKKLCLPMDKTGCSVARE